MKILGKINKVETRHALSLLAVIFIVGLIALAIIVSNCGQKTKNQITTTTTYGEVRILIAGSGSATIDWGDGSPVETLVLKDFLNWDEDGHAYSHKFSGTPPYAVKITGNVTHLNCQGMGITSLDVKRNTQLIELTCPENQLTSLDVSKNPELTELNCSNNQLISLDVSKNLKLKWLDCNHNQLKELDVGKNTDLRTLGCNQNRLTSLNVKNNPNLSWLNCSFNQLTNLDCSQNKKLDALYFNDNNLSAAAINALFESLNDIELYDSRKHINIANNPGTDNCQVNIAEQKQWDFAPYNNYEESGDPGILPFIAGIYRSSGDSDCRIFLNITKSIDENNKDRYFYSFLINDKQYKGDVAVSAIENYVVLEGIPYVEYFDPSTREKIPKHGVRAEWKDGELIIQNAGNVADTYQIFDCSSKIIVLVKE